MSMIDFEIREFYFGLEFEFYFKENGTKDEFFQKVIDSFEDEEEYFEDQTNIDYLANEDKWILSLEKSMPELSNNKKGIEFNTPILTYDELEENIECILNLIQEYGFTNESCGFHFHISTRNDKFDYPDIIKFLLFMEEEGIFEDYCIRNDFALNIMDVLKNTNIEVFRQWYKCLGKFYNIFFVDLDQKHIEIRILGNDKYELNENIKEFIEKITHIFFLSMTLHENEKYAIIYKKFKEEYTGQGIVDKDELMKLAHEHQVGYEEKFGHLKKTRILNTEGRRS